MRSAFIERVWSQRIVNGLERSVRHAVEMHLDVRNTPELVALSFGQSTAEPGQLLSIESAYAQAGHQLVIVGPPGSGKTTEALKLMRYLLVIARRDSSAPVPEIFPLASWAKEQRPILEWVGEQLRLRHGWSQREARSLIAHHQVAPVLDGLDEVAPEHRAACAEAINRFWQTHRGGPLVVCCRQVEYEQLPKRAKLGGAATVCSPEASQIDAYLSAAGERWGKVRDQLRGDAPALRELLSTPLMLSIAVLAYRDEGDPAELGGDRDGAASRDRLWSRYISTMIARTYDPKGSGREDTEDSYSEAQVRRWLGWLASEMRVRDGTELWLHEWMGSPNHQGMVRASLGVAFGVAFGLVSGLVGGLAIGLGSSPSPSYRPEKLDRAGLAVGLVSGLALGVVFGLVGGLVGGLACVVFHYAFRVWLRKHDRGPMRWVSFLEWASAHLLLRSTGASYQWVHLELRDHLVTSATTTPTVSAVHGFDYEA
jgi:hypothetical protein